MSRNLFLKKVSGCQLNMKKMNMTDEEICNILNITQKELEELTGK